MPIVIWSDNQGVIALTRDDKFHSCTKHLDIKVHWIRQNAQSGEFNIKYCPTAEMQADFLTKGLSAGQHKSLTELSGLRSTTSSSNCIIHSANSAYLDPRASTRVLLDPTDTYLLSSSQGSIFNTLRSPSNVTWRPVTPNQPL